MLNFVIQTLDVHKIFHIHNNKKLNWCWQSRATRLEIIKGHQYVFIQYVRYGFIILCYNNFVPKTNTIYFFTYSSSTNVGTDINRSTAYDFLLTFHGNHGPIWCTVSETNGDFGRKSQIFPTPCILAPLKGFPVELGIDAGGQKTRMMALPGRERSLAISSAVWIQ